MSLLVIPVSKSDYLVGIVLVISLVIAGIVAPAGIEALESSADYLIAFKPLFIYAYLDKVEYLTYSHVIRYDSIIECGFAQAVLVHLGDIVLGHKRRVTAGKCGHSSLQRTVGVCRAHAEALTLSSFNVGAVTVSAERGFACSYSEEKSVYLFAVLLTKSHAEQVPMLVYLLVEGVFDLLDGHFVVDSAYLGSRSVSGSVPLAEIEGIADALLLYIAGGIVQRLAGLAGEVPFVSVNVSVRRGIDRNGGGTKSGSGKYSQKLSFHSAHLRNSSRSSPSSRSRSI